MFIFFRKKAKKVLNIHKPTVLFPLERLTTLQGILRKIARQEILKKTNQKINISFLNLLSTKPTEKQTTTTHQLPTKNIHTIIFSSQQHASTLKKPITSF